MSGADNIARQGQGQHQFAANPPFRSMANELQFLFNLFFGKHLAHQVGIATAPRSGRPSMVVAMALAVSGYNSVPELISSLSGDIFP